MTDDTLMWRSMVYGILMWAITIYAFRRGGWEERLVALCGVVSSYLSPLLTSTDQQYRHVELAVFFVDFAHAMLLILIMMLSRKFWPIWVAAIAGVQLMGHLLPYMQIVSPIVYYNSIALWSYPAWIIIAVGVRRHSLARSSQPLSTKIRPQRRRPVLSTHNASLKLEPPSSQSRALPPLLTTTSAP